MRKVASARMIDSKAPMSAASVAPTNFFTRSRSSSLASVLARHAAPVRRETLAEPGARTRQCAGRGSKTDREQVSGILGGPVKHVTQNQSGPLLRCEQLDHRKKCEFDAFVPKRYRLRRPRRRGGWLEH